MEEHLAFEPFLISSPTKSMNITIFISFMYMCMCSCVSGAHLAHGPVWKSGGQTRLPPCSTHSFLFLAASKSWESRYTHCYICSLCELWDPDSGFQDCTARALPSEQSSQFQDVILHPWVGGLAWERRDELLTEDILENKLFPRHVLLESTNAYSHL